MERKSDCLLKYRNTFLLIAVLGVFLSFCVKVDASGDAGPSLALHYEAGEAEFYLYQVADFSETGTFDVIAPFSKYCNKIKGLNDLENHDSDDWRKLASTLENLVIENKIKPTNTKKSDSKGNLKWKNIPKGLYLVLGEKTKDSKYIYTPSPVLITVPNRDAAGNWDSHVEIEHNKLEKEEIEKKTSLKVVKIWKDSDYKEKRPSEIKVKLYRDGKSYDTVTLNAKNNWNHEWKDLSVKYKWTVTEENVPDSYQVEYSKEGTTVYIENEYKKPKIEKKPDKDKDKKDQEKQKELPQAGQLWWPVPILAVLGLAALLIGWMKRRT